MCTDTMKCVSNNTKRKRFSKTKKELTERPCGMLGGLVGKKKFETPHRAARYFRLLLALNFLS